MECHYCANDKSDGHEVLQEPYRGKIISFDKTGAFVRPSGKKEIAQFFNYSEIMPLKCHTEGRTRLSEKRTRAPDDTSGDIKIGYLGVQFCVYEGQDVMVHNAKGGPWQATVETVGPYLATVKFTKNTYKGDPKEIFEYPYTFLEPLDGIVAGSEMKRRRITPTFYRPLQRDTRRSKKAPCPSPYSTFFEKHSTVDTELQNFMIKSARDELKKVTPEKNRAEQKTISNDHREFMRNRMCYIKDQRNKVFEVGNGGPIGSHQICHKETSEYPQFFNGSRALTTSSADEEATYMVCTLDSLIDRHPNTNLGLMCLAQSYMYVLFASNAMKHNHLKEIVPKIFESIGLNTDHLTNNDSPIKFLLIIHGPGPCDAQFVHDSVKDGYEIFTRRFDVVSAVAGTRDKEGVFKTISSRSASYYDSLSRGDRREVDQFVERLIKAIDANSDGNETSAITKPFYSDGDSNESNSLSGAIKDVLSSRKSIVTESVEPKPNNSIKANLQKILGTPTLIAEEENDGNSVKSLNVEALLDNVYLFGTSYHTNHKIRGECSTLETICLSNMNITCHPAEDSGVSFQILCKLCRKNISNDCNYDSLSDALRDLPKQAVLHCLADSEEDGLEFSNDLLLLQDAGDAQEQKKFSLCENDGVFLLRLMNARLLEQIASESERHASFHRIYRGTVNEIFHSDDAGTNKLIANLQSALQGNEEAKNALSFAVPNRDLTIIECSEDYQDDSYLIDEDNSDQILLQMVNEIMIINLTSDVFPREIAENSTMQQGLRDKMNTFLTENNAFVHQVLPIPQYLKMLPDDHPHRPVYNKIPDAFWAFVFEASSLLNNEHRNESGFLYLFKSKIQANINDIDKVIHNGKTSGLTFDKLKKDFELDNSKRVSQCPEDDSIEVEWVPNENFMSFLKASRHERWLRNIPLSKWLHIPKKVLKSIKAFSRKQLLEYSPCVFQGLDCNAFLARVIGRNHTQYDDMTFAQTQQVLMNAMNDQSYRYQMSIDRITNPCFIAREEHLHRHNGQIYSSTYIPRKKNSKNSFIHKTSSEESFCKSSNSDLRSINQDKFQIAGSDCAGLELP